MDTAGGPPYRADHVGSLLRPAALHAARAQFAAGAIDAAALARAEDAAILDAIALQRDVGLQSVTDGEFRRGTWHMDFIYALGGVHKVDEKLIVKFHNEGGDLEFTPAGLRVSERVHLEKTIFEDAFRFVQAHAGDMTPKMTIPSPSMVHYRGGRASIDPTVYPDLEQFWADLGVAYGAEIDALGRLGCTYLQIDDTSLAYLNDPKQRAELNERGDETDQLHLRYINTINAALASKPAGMTVTTHLCRGNFRSSWVADGGYDYVADALFNQLHVDGFFLEFDDARSGTFEPLRFVPKHKRVVLGLVTTKRPALESRDELLRRIEEASRYVALDQLCLSPQCGFSSTVEGNTVSAEDQRAKLALVVETAREVWG